MISADSGSFRSSATWRLLALALLFTPGLLSAQIQFEDASVAAGISGNAAESYGASWGDLDNNGYPDLFISNHRNQGRLWQNSNGLFTDVSAAADLSNAFGPNSQINEDTHGASWADINNDGFQDLHVTVSTQAGYFLINDGLSGLTDMRSTLGLTLGHDNGSRIPVFFDANNDGRLDLKIIGNRETASNFFLQQSDNTFLLDNSLGMTCPGDSYWAQLADFDAAGTLEFLCADGGGMPARVIDYNTGTAVDLAAPYISRTRDIIAGDFNNDLRQDMIHVLGTFRPSETVLADSDTAETHVNITGTGSRTITLDTLGSLSTDLDADNWNLVNRGDGSVDNVFIGASGYHPLSLALNLDPSGDNLGIQDPAGREGMFVGYENSQWTIVVNNPSGFGNGYYVFDSTAPITAADMTPIPAGDLPLTPTLQTNTAGGFVDTTAGSGLTPEVCVSGVAADLDNDMDLDLFLGCRGGSTNIANVVFENLGGGVFQKILNHGGEGLLGASLGAAAGTTESVISADYDVDGFVDIFVSNGLNLVPWLMGGESQLFRNLGNSNNWIQLDLTGIASNSDGVGAKVYVEAGGVTQYREQNGGYHRWAQNHQRLHFGLGTHDTANVTIVWPGGATDVYNDVAAKVLYQATEQVGLTELINRIEDTDGDGLTDEDETNIHGTDPNNPDSDGGGARDGTEIAAGTDPNDPADDATALPLIWVEDSNAAEASGTLEFTVSIAAASLDDIEVNFASQDVTAVDGVDYTGSSGTVTLPAGQLSATVSFDVLDNATEDGDREFEVQISSPLNALLGSPSTAIGSILDDDTLEFAVTDIQVSEAQGTAVFTVDLLAESTDLVSLDYATVADTAGENIDYIAASGQLVFNPGETSQTVTVTLLDDGEFESAEAFQLMLSNPVNAALPDNLAMATIADDETSFCGEPTFSGATDQATFLWKDCDGSDMWHIRVTGGGVSGSITYTGSFEAAGGFPVITEFSIEGSDSIVTSATSIEYSMLIWNVGADGLDIQITPNTCFTPQDPAALPVYTGASRTLMDNPSLDLTSGTACVDTTDTDGDGLTDAEEALLGTDPGLADTDSDTLSDGEEVNSYGTDPLLADTDSDTLSDAAELNTHATNPLLADTDSDDLTDGSEIITYGTDPLLADTDGSGVSDGDEVNIHGLDPLDPGDDATVLDTDSDGLTDAQEVLLGTNPALADTDSDTLNDGDEVNTYGTDPLLSDTDSDALNDADEINIHGTDPLLADTDTGGVDDGDEIFIQGTDPLVGADDDSFDGLVVDWEMSQDVGPVPPQYPDSAGPVDERLYTVDETAISSSAALPPLTDTLELPSNADTADGAQVLRTDSTQHPVATAAPLDFVRATSFTVDGWALFTVQGGPLFSLGDGQAAGANQYIRVVADSATNQLVALLQGAVPGINTVSLPSANDALTPGAWFHYALVRDCGADACDASGDSLTLYLNGQPVANAPDIAGPVSPGANNAILIGAAQNATGVGYALGDGWFIDAALDGAVSRTRLWNKALAAADIEGLYLSAATYPVAIQVNNNRPLHANHNDINVSPNLDDLVPVVIVGDANIAAADVDPASLRFGPGEATDDDGSVTTGELTGDSLLDIAADFYMSDSGITCEATEISLTGLTAVGQPFAGTETITTDCDATCH